MKRTTCSTCNEADLVLFLDLGETPIADAYTTSPGSVSALHPLQLAVCTRCWLVQLMEVVDHKTLFGTGYSFYSSASPPLSQYHQLYAEDILSQHSHGSFVVEIGCNDGDMLRHFHQAEWPCLGVDPAEGPANRAKERGLDVWIQPFDNLIAREIVDSSGRAEVVIANHVLAHAQSVYKILSGIQTLLARYGKAYIEVQYLPDLLINNAFDLVYHEHRHFFSATSLRNALDQFDLAMVGAQWTDRQGGSLRVEVMHKEAQGLRRWWAPVFMHEDWLSRTDAYSGFQGRVDRVAHRLQEVLIDIDGPIIGYGAPAKATTLLNYCGITSDTLDCVLDTTKAKQRRYIPGTGIEIVAPESVNLDEQEAILLLAWNYAAPILRNHRDYKGSWILPIPAPIVL